MWSSVRWCVIASSVRWCVIAVVRGPCACWAWRDSDGAGPTRVDDGSSGIWHGLPSVWVFVRPGIRPQIQIGSTRIILLPCRAYLNWITLKKPLRRTIARLNGFPFSERRISKIAGSPEDAGLDGPGGQTPRMDHCTSGSASCIVLWIHWIHHGSPMSVTGGLPAPAAPCEIGLSGGRGDRRPSGECLMVGSGRLGGLHRLGHGRPSVIVLRLPASIRRLA